MSGKESQYGALARETAKAFGIVVDSAGSAANPLVAVKDLANTKAASKFMDMVMASNKMTWDFVSDVAKQTPEAMNRMEQILRDIGPEAKNIVSDFKSDLEKKAVRKSYGWIGFLGGSTIILIVFIIVMVALLIWFWPVIKRSLPSV